MTNESIKAAIREVIKQNGNEEITGNILQQVLLAMVNTMSFGYKFFGVATPETVPVQTDQNIFYIIAKQGNYVNFNNIIFSGGIAFLKFVNGAAWEIETLRSDTEEFVRRGAGEGAVILGENQDNQANGAYSVAGGYNVTVGGRQSFGFGQDISISAGADNSIAIGYLTRVLASRGFAGGNSSWAVGANTFSYGYLCRANGGQSFALGNTVTTNGSNSFACGVGLLTNNTGEVAFGQYNLSVARKTAFSIGAGTSNTSRKNLFEIDKDGGVYMIGVGGYDGTNANNPDVLTVQQVMNA